MLDNFCTKINQRTFDTGELIPLQSDSLWLLQQGVVKTCAWSEKGNPITLGYWGKNDFLGQALPMVYPYEIRCLTTVVATCLLIDEVDDMTNFISSYTQQVEEFLWILRGEKIYQRLRQMLVWLANKFGEEIGFGQLINLRITHQDLAEVIGATRVSITKIINQLEKEDFLSRPERNTIVIHQ